MNRKIFTLLMVLALALTGALLAQTYPNTQSTTPPSQQVDQSGKPEQTGKPDVDVDVGKNANGAVDVDVKAHGDSDTAASGINETGENTNTGTYNANNTAGDNANLPGTASNTPLLGLIGLLALGLAFTLRAIR